MTRAWALAALAALTQAAWAADDPLARAKELFTRDASPPCAMCHTLKDAGASGQIGPSLDELKPNEQRVTTAVRNGIGVMPPYPSLSQADVQALARYVARASGGN